MESHARRGIFCNIEPQFTSMIKPVLRQEIFTSNKNITSLIHELQKAMHEDDDNFENEYEKTKYDAQFDLLDSNIKKSKQHNFVIDFSHNDLTTYTAVLSEKLLNLLTILSIKELYIISDLKWNLLGTKKNNHPPLKESRKRFEKLIKKGNHDEAFVVDMENLPQCLETFFWLERCDPTSPAYIFFTDKEDRFAFTLCKYGNLHVTEFETEILTEDILIETGWHIVDEICSEKFSKTSAIEGRKASR